MAIQSENPPAPEAPQEQIRQRSDQEQQERPWLLKKRYMVPIFSAALLLLVAAMFRVADSTGVEEPIPLPINNTISTEPASSTSTDQSP